MSLQISSQSCKRFYSQNGEDVILSTLFREQNYGFFVEVGCIDGRRFSNTLTFEEDGWSGICVEAHAGYVDLLKYNRPKSVVCNCAVGACDVGSVTFYANSRGSLSTLDPSMEDHFRKKFGAWFTGFEEQEVPMRTLDSIFRENNVSKIDILSLDIEGYEIEALKGLDLDLYRPKVMVIECDEIDQEDEVDRMVLHKGYVKVTKLSQNIFYVINEFKSKVDTLNGNSLVADLVHTLHPLDSGVDEIKHVVINI